MDVEALFPSIDQEVSARIVAEELVKHGVEYEGVDVRLATHYLGICMTRERQIREGVSHLIPARKTRSRRGRKLTIYNKTLSGPMKRVKKGKEGEEEEGGVGGEESMIGRNLDEAEGEEEDQGEEEEEDQKWVRFGRDYSKEERRLIISKVIMVAVETAFWTHIYSF